MFFTAKVWHYQKWTFLVTAENWSKIHFRLDNELWIAKSLVGIPFPK